jgi:hypothetical protein
MLSQISYLGSIITPDPDQLEEMQKIINDFVKGSMRISGTGITNTIAKGGLGMIDI